MANEVINETEDANQNETSAIEETNNQSAVETPTEETAVEATAEEAPAEAKADETPVETKTEETPALEASNADSGDEAQNANDIDFGAILEKFEADQTIYHSGELVEGKVVGVSERGVLIDFGYKSEGAVPLEEFTTPEGEVTVKQGDMVEVVIRTIHTGDQPPILSRYDALRRKSWDVIEKAYNDEVPVKGRVMEKTKGGLRVDLDGVEAFLPGSQIDSRPIRNLDSYRGQEIEAKVIKFSRKRNNIVLSRKILTDEVYNKQKNETLGNIEEGYVIEGTVKNLTEYGAFVDIGGIDGLLHVTDMSWSRQQNPGDLFKPGENVQVKVLKLDREKGKVSLGYKQLIPDPWQTVPELYPVGEKIKGKISSVTDYGAFVELEKGIEGLIHVSEMSWSKRARNPKSMLRKGEEVEVQILGIDTEDHRISLGLKQLMPNPWETVKQRYHVGDRVHGAVRNITDFGAFIEIEEGIDGLVHVSDITWSKKIRHPRELLERDQEVDAIITSIDPAGRRMSLSMKDIAPSEWESFVATHKPGDIIRGKVSRFAGFGVFVEMGNELEGLCHISELSDERVERPEDVVQIGQEMDFKILRIEHDDQKIGLSARAVSREAETGGIDSRSYSSEAKGGMASLAELANLKFGRGSSEEPAKEEPKLSKKERKALKMQERAAAAEEAAAKAENEPEAPETDTAEASTGEGSVSETGEETSAAESTTEETVEATSETGTAGESEEPTTEAAETEAVVESNSDAEAKTEAQETSPVTSETEETTSETGEQTAYPGAAETEASAQSDTEGEAESAPETTEARDEAIAEDAETAKTTGETGETTGEIEGKTANN